MTKFDGCILAELLKPSTACLEEVLQHSGGFAGADAAIDLGPVVTGFLGEKARSVFDRPALLVLGREIKPAQPREGNGAGAHGAGFQRRIEVAAGQPFVVEDFRARADDQHFGMGGRVMVLDGAISGAGENFAILDEAGANWRLAARRRRPRFGEGAVPRVVPRVDVQ